MNAGALLRITARCSEKAMSSAFKPAPELNLMPGRTLNVMVLLSGLTVQLCTAPPSSFFRSSAS